MFPPLCFLNKNRVAFKPLRTCFVWRWGELNPPSRQPISQLFYTCLYPKCHLNILFLSDFPLTPNRQISYGKALARYF